MILLRRSHIFIVALFLLALGSAFVTLWMRPDLRGQLMGYKSPTSPVGSIQGDQCKDKHFVVKVSKQKSLPEDSDVDVELTILKAELDIQCDTVKSRTPSCDAGCYDGGVLPEHTVDDFIVMANSPYNGKILLHGTVTCKFHRTCGSSSENPMNCNDIQCLGGVDACNDCGVENCKCNAASNTSTGRCVSCSQHGDSCTNTADCCVLDNGTGGYTAQECIEGKCVDPNWGSSDDESDIPMDDMIDIITDIENPSGFPIEPLIDDLEDAVSIDDVELNLDMPSVCGNGIVEVPEECDDSIETALCTQDCTNSFCGDGYVNFTAGEECEADLLFQPCTPECKFRVW